MRIKTIHIVVIIAAIVLGAGGWVWAFYELPEPEACEGSISGTYLGSFYVNEAGSPKGDSNYTATYTANLGTMNGVGALLLMYDSGDGDQLAQHTFNVSGFCAEEDAIRLTLEGNDITLDWIAEDLVWEGNYSNHFIASRGPDADSEEVRGSIFARHFPGLAEDYYVELRLQPP
ncbi:MAG: hypothetical protein KAU99_06890 [Thermoplasmata archaeon]|nr:hypothetical protein [Thermoplasmata archaeon]